MVESALSGLPQGPEAAAVLLMVLDDGEAAELLSHLDPAEVQQLGSAVFGLTDISEHQVEDVFDTFIGRARKATTIGFGAAGRIRAVMENALGAERAETMLSRITPSARSPALDALRWMAPKTIADLIEHEHPQVAALVLSHLDAPNAADVLQLLPQVMQVEVIHRVATLQPVTAEALDDLERLLVCEVTRSSAPSTKRGGAGEAAKIMNNLVPGADQRIIRAIAKNDKNVAQTIQDEMFVFDDLSGCDDKNLGLLMRSIDGAVLVVALKGAEEKLKARIFGCMSNRAASTIQDEMAERGPMRLAEVLEAQKEVLAVARRMADEGTLMLAGRGGDYV
ncbi:flagellar motor switch protein FliG [Sphingoaurantiacus capsulatus]|uniref:Flagellar motor switch protein FliG n=1 Tax=Sphingoaurantiacus capsulatus TaxID=1771310 RepID=A0ABV7XDV7_9SPHN